MASREIDILVRDGEHLEEARHSYATSWSAISGRLPRSLGESQIHLVRDYFRVQLRVARGQRVKARRILQGLDKKHEFKKFEEHNQSILAAVDIAVRGVTHRIKDDSGNPIEPAFRLNHS